MNDSLPCPAEWHSEEPDEYREHLSECQHSETTFFLFSTSFLNPSPNALITHQLNSKNRYGKLRPPAAFRPLECAPEPSGNRNAPIDFAGKANSARSVHEPQTASSGCTFLFYAGRGSNRAAEPSSGIKFLAETLMIQAEGPIPISPRFPWAFPRGPRTAKRLTTGLSNPWRRLTRPAQNNGVQASHISERRIGDSAFLRRRPQEEVRPRETRTDSRKLRCRGNCGFPLADLFTFRLASGKTKGRRQSRRALLGNAPVRR